MIQLHALRFTAPAAGGTAGAPTDADGRAAAARAGWCDMAEAMVLQAVARARTTHLPAEPWPAGLGDDELAADPTAWLLVDVVPWFRERGLRIGPGRAAAVAWIRSRKRRRDIAGAAELRGAALGRVHVDTRAMRAEARRRARVEREAVQEQVVELRGRGWSWQRIAYAVRRAPATCRRLAAEVGA